MGDMRGSGESLLSGRDKHGIVTGFNMPLGWDHGFLFNIHLPNQRDTDQIPHSHSGFKY